MIHNCRHVRLPVAVALLASAAQALAAQPSRIARVRAAAETIVAADLMRDVTYIASDALLGRATPSPGLNSAQAYVVRRLTQLGVKPAGDDGSYLQHYTVATAVLDTNATYGVLGGERLAWRRDFVVPTLLTLGAREGGIVYVGSGILAPKLGVDPYAGIDVRGKWLLVHAAGLPQGITRQALGARGIDWTSPPEEAVSRGALGLLMIPLNGVTPAWAARGRVPVGRDLKPVVGRAFTNYPLPQLMLTRRAVEQMFAGEKLSAADIFASDTTHLYAASFALTAARTLKLDLVGESSTIRPSNVLGFIEGSDPVLRNEWITVSTHLDGAVGHGATASGDSIFNAADDNGSGSAGNLAIARALMRGPRPKRSILLVWDSGEETGLWGSRFLAYSPLAEKVVAHFTVDMIARTKVPGTNIKDEEELTGPGEVYVSGPGILSTQMDSVLARITREYHFISLNRKYEDPNHEFFYPRTDAAPYVENGIPYAEFFTGLHGDYHAQTDEVWKLDPVKFQAVARTVYVTLWTLADDPVRPRIDKPIPPVLSFMKPR
jgi:Predicted aminopeptidases